MNGEQYRTNHKKVGVPLLGFPLFFNDTGMT